MVGAVAVLGRRSVHTPEELRQLILEASRGIIEREGLAGLSAREVARLIGYSAGTLYNIFDNLDDILITLQAQILTELVDEVQAVPEQAEANTYIESVTNAYVGYALRNPRLWNLLFAHTAAPDPAARSVIHEHLNKIVSTVGKSLQRLVPKMPREELDMNTRVLIAGIHGITAIAVTGKAPTLTADMANDYANHLTKNFILGLRAK